MFQSISFLKSYRSKHKLYSLFCVCPALPTRKICHSSIFMKLKCWKVKVEGERKRETREKEVKDRKALRGKERLSSFPSTLMAQWIWMWLVTMRMWVWFLAFLGGIRIWYCCELWCGLQMWLGSDFAVVVAQASGYSSDLTPSLETSLCWGKKKSGKERKEKEMRIGRIVGQSLCQCEVRKAD